MPETSFFVAVKNPGIHFPKQHEHLKKRYPIFNRFRGKKDVSVFEKRPLENYIKTEIKSTPTASCPFKPKP